DNNAGANAAPLWKTNLGPSVGTSYIGCGDLVPEIGITSTPVFDQTGATIYVVAKTRENGQYILRLHALNTRTGLPITGSPVVLQASASGHGDGNDGHGNVPYNSFTTHQRAALLL